MRDDNFDDYFDESDAPSTPASDNPAGRQPVAPAADDTKHVDFTDDIADDEAKAKQAEEGKQRKKRKSHFWIYALLVIIIALGVTCYFRYFSPCLCAQSE